MADDIIEFEVEKGVPLRRVASAIATLALELEIPVIVLMHDMTLEVEPGATASDILGGYAAARAQKQLKSARKKPKK